MLLGGIRRIYAGIVQAWIARESWGQGGGVYGKRFASALSTSAIHGVLAFGLDSALHQDPRYFRSRDPGFWCRTAHAFQGLYRHAPESGGETESTRRLGSAYGAAFSFQIALVIVGVALC